jgi:hypothetical protein
MPRINERVGTREKKTDVDVDYELPLEAVRETIVNLLIETIQATEVFRLCIP